MSIVIKKASCEDAEAILEYLRQVGGETDNLTFGAEGLPCTAEEEARYIQQLEDSCDGVMFVAKDGTRIIGDASLNRLPRRMKHRGDFGIAVLREYWNRGIGSRLLREVIRFAGENSFEGIDLQVRSDNAAAIRLYEKFGFQKIGTHRSFFKIGKEEISFDYMYLKIQEPGGQKAQRMNAALLGKCGVYCGACPTYLASNCKGCADEHTKGDCFSRDCAAEKGLDFCGQCGKFPCDDIMNKPHATALDRDWLLWKRSSNTNR